MTNRLSAANFDLSSGIGVYDRRERTRIKRERRLIDLAIDKYGLFSGKSVKPRSKALATTLDALAELRAEEADLIATVKSKDLQAEAVANGTLALLKFVKAGNDPRDFKPDAEDLVPDELGEAQFRLPAVQKARRRMLKVVQLAERDFWNEITEQGYGKFYEALEAELESHRPDDSMPHREYVQAVEDFETVERELADINKLVATKVFGGDLTRVRGATAQLNMRVVDARELIGADVANRIRQDTHHEFTLHDSEEAESLIAEREEAEREIEEGVEAALEKAENGDE